MWINIITILFTSGHPYMSESVVYRLQWGARSFESSREYCTWTYDGLAEIYNENLQHYLSSVASGKEVWIGVSKCNSIWCYSGTGKMVSYTNWAEGEPNNYYSIIFGAENCVLMLSSSEWNDENCSEEHSFMCQELHCKATTCNRRGTCEELAGGFRCHCDHRFYGNNCENEKCKATNCNRRGTCVQLSHGFRCICDQGFYGNSCENEKCKATSCSRRGTCVELVNGFRCFCQHGFYGRNCENVISCAIITNPDHSMIKCKGLYGENHFQAVCTFTCDLRFILIGDNSTICQASGSWTTYNTTCQALTCPLLKKPAHSSVNCSGPYGGKHYNTSCYFSCDDGYTLEGDQKTICGESGNWNSHDVQCSMNYLKPILISVGVLIATAPLMLSVICWWKRRKSEGQNNTSDDFPMQQKTVEYENQDIYIIPTPYLNNDTPQEEIYVNLSIDQKMHKDLH